MAFQDGEIVREHGDRKAESIEDMFYLCGDNNDGMRCSACKKEREDLFDVARRYITYEDRTGNCPAFRIPVVDNSASKEGVQPIEVKVSKKEIKSSEKK